MMKKKPKMRNRYIVRSGEWTLKSRKSAVARTFTDLYTPEARSEFVLPVFPIFYEDDQLVRSSDVVEKTYVSEYLRHIVPARALSTPLLGEEYHDGDDKRLLRSAPQLQLQSGPMRW